MVDLTSKKDDEGLSPFPLTPIYIDKKNRSIITDITVITEEEKKSTLSRNPTSFYISKNIASGWRQYCHVNGRHTHELTEEAFIEYMRNHPLPQVSLSVTQDLASYAPTMRDRLRNKILKEKITNVLVTLRRVKESGKGEGIFRRQLQKLVLQATNLKRPDDELIELLRDVEKFL
jgi:hypothetical protein